MKVSFVIPIWNHFHLINNLLADIRDHCTPDETVVVDDCSTDTHTLDGLNWWAFNYGIRILRPIENLKFLKASNYGMKKSEGDIICLISSDVRIELDLAKIVRDLLTDNPRRLIGGVLHAENTGWNEFDNHIYRYIEGWLLCATREAWETWGYFDERFAPNDFEDVDISTTALTWGYDLYPLNAPEIQHLVAQTIGYTEERRQITEKNRESFRAKWITKHLESESVNLSSPTGN